MQIKLQIVKIEADGQKTIHDITCLEREELTFESLGLSLKEGQDLLKTVQEIF